MRYRILLSFLGLLLFTANSFAGDSYVISLKNFEIVSKLRGYGVTEVFTAREGQNCIGFVYKGAMNKRMAARMLPSVEADAGECLKRSFPKAETAIPLTVRINSLRIYEITGSSLEKAFAEVNLSFLIRQGDTLVELFTAGRSNRRSGMDVTGGHPKGLAQMLAACFDDFSDALAQGTTTHKVVPADSLHINPLDRPMNFPIFKATQIPRGLFRTYYEFRDARPDTGTPFTVECLKPKKDTTCSRARIDVQDTARTDDWFGFSDGSHLYVNLGNHYVRVNIESGKIKLTLNRDEVGNSNNTAAALGAAFGLVGGLIGGLMSSGSNAGEAGACVIDLTSGQLLPEKIPQYLDMVSHTVFLLSKTSASGSSLTVKHKDDTVCTLPQGNYLHLRLPGEYDSATLSFSGPNSPAVEQTFECEPFTWEVLIVKIKSNGKITFTHAFDQVKRDLIYNMAPENTLVYP